MSTTDINILDKEAAALMLGAKIKKPRPIPARKAPNGLGGTKGDILMHRLAAEFKLDPIKELVKMSQRPDITSELRFKIMNELLSYYMPKMKATDTNPNQGEVISVNIKFPD